MSDYLRDKKHRDVMRRIAEMTAAEMLASVVRSGICNEKGTLTKRYGGTAEDAPERPFVEAPVDDTAESLARAVEDFRISRHEPDLDASLRAYRAKHPRT